MDQPEVAPSAPFLVRGRIGDTQVERPVQSVEDAQRFARLAAESGGDSWGSWMVLPDDPAAPAMPILLFGRLRKGVTGESRREVHALVIMQGLLLAPQLAAACGVRLGRDDLEFVERGQYLPCERCLQRLGMADPDMELPPAPPVIPAPPPTSLSDLHPEVRELLTQLGHERPTLPGRGRIELPSDTTREVTPL